MTTTTATPETPKLRLLFIGSFGAGKTTMIHAYLSGKPLVVRDGKIDSSPPVPPGLDQSAPTFLKDIKIDGRDVKLSIVDTAGEERFSTVSCSFYKGAHAVVVVYDCTDVASFEAAPDWLGEATTLASNKTQLVLALMASKVDDSGSRVVTRAQGEELATRREMPYFEATATNVDSISSAVVGVVRAVIKAVPALAPPMSSGSPSIAPRTPPGSVIKVDATGAPLAPLAQKKPAGCKCTLL